MKTITFKRDSFHYWLANFGVRRTHSHTDICSYTRNVIAGTFLFLICAILALAVTTIVCYSFGNLIGWLLFDYVLEDTTRGFFFFFGSLTIGIGALAVGVITKEYIEEKVNNTQPGFVRVAYRSWKDKWCAKVDFK